MNTDEQDGAIIEIEDDVWDAVGAMIALICEFNGEPYFDAEGTDLKEESMHGIDCLEQTESNSTIMDAERNNLRAITKNIVSSIVQEISKTFSKPDCQNSPEAHEALTTDASTAPESISRDEADSNGRLEIKYADVCIAPSSKVQVPQGILLSSQDNNDMSLIELKHESQDELNCFPSKLQFSADHENLSVPSVGAESKVPSFLAQLASDDNGQVNTDINGDSKASDPLNYSTNQMHLRVPLSSTGTELKKSVGVTNHMRFYCENESTIEQNSVAMISSLLDFVTGSKKEKYMQNQLSHADFCKIAVAVRFSYYDSEQKCAPLFEKLSLLHILCIQRNVFDETVYDELVCAGCTPEVEMSTGCNVFAFAATRGNFKAMHYITMKHSSILKTALYSCHDADRNLLNCIMEHAAPSDFDSLLEYLGPSVCSELCTNFKDVGVSQVFVALKSGNYAFLQSISKQVYLWNITAADLGDQQTFLSAMMTNPNAHGTLLKMISNITSLESFVIQSTEGIRDASMMLQTFQAGHTQIVSHVIRQQHNLYFSEWDKSDAASKIDARMTKSQLTAFLSSLLGKNQSNTVALWHCIHLVTSLSHDEEMALDLLSTANLDAVKHHHHWRSFDRFNGESALHIAAQKDWKEIVSCLCDLGHDFNPFCFMMRTPMYVSALHNSLKSLKLLNNVGADASIENGDGKSPIMCSIETKNTECSMEILSNLSSRKSLFRTDSKGLSPLMRALQSKQLQVAHAILKKYPEQANFVTINGNNIFHAAAPHLASVQQLVSWSSQERKDIRGFLQQKNNDGETPKDICAHCGYLDSLRFFLQIHQSKGSINSSKSLQNIDVHISESVDAFSRINFSSTTSIQKFLSKHIESINCHDFYHRTPFILAVQAKNLQGARDLVDAGVDILKTDDLGNCAMHYMFLLNREQALWMWEEPTTSDTDPSDMLQCIIQRNSEDSVAKCLTLKNKAGITPFCMAVMNEFYVDVALLCGELKFPKHLLNVQLPNGTYCLHIACAKNLINLAMLFLSLGSDPSVLNSDGMSPEYIARTHRHNSIILILMQFCNALRIQCAIRSYLSRIHALAHRADCISVQNSVFKLIDNTNTALQQYIDLRGNFPRANWNSIEHPKHPDIVPMAHAAMCNNTQALKFILDLKLDPNVRGKVSGSSPLALAIERGSTDCIKLLLSAAADVNIRDNRQRTPVHCAAEKGFLGSLKILSEYHPNYNALDENQCTPMMLSLTSGSFLTSKPLIEYSSKTMNVPSQPSGNTALLEAISRSADIDVIKAILIHGGEVLVTNNFGQTALSMSLEMGNAVLEFIFRELLIWCNGFRELGSISFEERSFFVDVVFEVAEIFENISETIDRNSKLQDLTRLASKNHRFTSIEWLLSPSTGGLDFLDISSCLLMACDSPVENMPIIIALIKFRKKCDVLRPIMEYVDGEGRSVLHICAMRGHVNIMTLLIDEILSERAVCKFDLQDSSGRTPFFLACHGGHINVVRNLMQYTEVNLHLGDSSGGRPIVAALINGHLDVVASIFEVDPTLALDVSNNGTSILHIIAARDEYLPLAIRVMSIPNGRSLLGCARHTLNENGSVESSLPIDIAVKYDALKMVSHLRKMSMSLQERKILNLQSQMAEKMAESTASLTSGRPTSAKIVFTRDSLHRKSQATLLQNNVRCYFARITVKRHRGTFLLYCRRFLEAIIADDVQAVNYILREWPALIRIVLKDGLSALYLACENAAAGVLDFLLANGIDVNEVNHRNRNCLHYAVLSTVAHFVRKVAAFQVSHSLQDYQGNTPLHLACINGDSAVADELLYLTSAPLSIENKEKLNPDEVAIINGHDALARKLVETKKHSAAQWDDFGGKTKFSSKVEADWISIRQNAIRRKATTQLQCVYRKYASRNILRLLAMKRHFRNQAAVLIKLSIKTAIARNKFFVNIQATLLQRNWIVHKCRLFYIELKEKMRMVQARLRICCVTKMNACRCKYKPQKAAASIQRVFLGHVSRKPYKDFVDKVHFRRRNFFSLRLQSAFRQHICRNQFRLRKKFVSLKSKFSRLVAFRKFGPEIQFLSLRRWVQHIATCAKSFLQRRDFGVKTGNLSSLRYYLPEITRIQQAYASHKQIESFRFVREKNFLLLFRDKRNHAASVISNNCRILLSKRQLKDRDIQKKNFSAFLLQYYVFNRIESEASYWMLKNASNKIANMYKIHRAKNRVHYLKGEPVRRELLLKKAICVSIISRQVRCFLAKLRFNAVRQNSIIKHGKDAALCILSSWRCYNARKVRNGLATVALLQRTTKASAIVKRFMSNHAKDYKYFRHRFILKCSVHFLSTYLIALSVRMPLQKHKIISIIQRTWRSHRARLYLRKLRSRRLNGALSIKSNGKVNGQRSGSAKMKTGSSRFEEKSSLYRPKNHKSPKRSEHETQYGEILSNASADDNMAICDSEYDLEDKSQIFSRYLGERSIMKRSDSVPLLPALDPLWRDASSLLRPSSSASVRHYISHTVPSELGLGIEHRGNIKRLLEAKSYGQNDFFPAPRDDYSFDKHAMKRPSSSSMSRTHSRPSSSMSKKSSSALSLSQVLDEQTLGVQSMVVRPVWLKMIVLTGAAALHTKIESPFQASAFENAVRKKNPQLALEIAESSLTTSKTHQSQDQYDTYILALISFAIIEAIKILPDKSNSSSLVLLQFADETIRSRGQHLEDKNLLRVWCHDAVSMYYYYRNKCHAAEEAVIKAIRCVDHRLSNENHCILLQHAALIRLRNGKPKEAESSARRAIRVVYPSFDPDVSSESETEIPLPPIHSLGLVGSLLNFSLIMLKTAQGIKAKASLNVSIHLLEGMMPFQSVEAVQLMTLASSIKVSL